MCLKLVQQRGKRVHILHSTHTVYVYLYVQYFFSQSHNYDSLMCMIYRCTEGHIERLIHIRDYTTYLDHSTRYNKTYTNNNTDTTNNNSILYNQILVYGVNFASKGDSGSLVEKPGMVSSNLPVQSQAVGILSGRLSSDIYVCCSVEGSASCGYDIELE